MIEFLNNDPILNHSHSLTITYPRTISITHGNYPFAEDIHNLIIEVKNNISEKQSYATNVKGGKTDWGYFINNKIVTKQLKMHGEMSLKKEIMLFNIFTIVIIVYSI